MECSRRAYPQRLVLHVNAEQCLQKQEDQKISQSHFHQKLISCLLIQQGYILHDAQGIMRKCQYFLLKHDQQFKMVLPLIYTRNSNKIIGISLQFLLILMKTKSKSTLHIKIGPPQNPEVKISKHELQQLYEKQSRLEILEDKVNQSKPILETIYEKIKRKEHRYTQEIKKLELKVQQKAHVLQDYKQLYEKSLRVMDRNKIIQKYKGSSNYLPQDSKRQENFEQKQKFDWKNINKQNKLVWKNYTIDQIKKKYLVAGHRFTKEQIYKLYKDKLGEKSNESMLLDSPSRLTAKQRSKQLLQSFDKDLKHLGEFRSRGISQHFPKRHNDTTDQKRLKQIFLKMQHQKLLKI